MLIGLISDTHITEKRGKLSEKVLEEFSGVDLIIHAGDITHEKVIHELESAAPVVAVLGNNDKLDFNKTEIVEAGNFRIAVNHATSYSDDFEKLLKFALKMDADVVVSGHTHKPHCRVIDGILFVNPGSSNRPIKSDASVAVLDIGDNQKKADEIEVNFINL
ncbi:metallophosphoesterase family protein [Methanobrevibacter sp.]|uniref:metallophosphoesterase family protein n=1 Tax=Methanobrevibacter sp. TaxID=66852 RepID=UPI0038906E84